MEAPQFDPGLKQLLLRETGSVLGDGISGTIGVLTKPTDEDTLLAAVRFALQRREDANAEAPPSIRCFG